jgi:predicted ATPase
MDAVPVPQAELVRQVRHALAKLYDPASLQNHPLTLLLALPAEQPGHSLQAGTALRQRLLQTIELLRPDGRADPDSSAWRPYRLLLLRYVEALDVVEVQHQLAMSKSQYYRDHEHAVERLATLLCDRASPSGGETNATTQQKHQHLPVELTSFVGRENEVREVTRLLGTTRLLTLTGAGGSGKTRLAVQVAGAVAGAYSEGVWAVELAPVAEPRLVAQTVAVALGIREEPGQMFERTIVRKLSHKRLLLLLDNCEHLIDSCARLSDELLRACPEMSILATSREPLNMQGETIFEVPTLATADVRALPDWDRLREYESIRLFVDRAASVETGFTLTPDNAAAVAAICSRLDGIPLAIELAAARVQVLSVQQLNERLHNPLHLLTRGSRTALPRHRTLHATFEWSYELLSEPERKLVRMLSVFAGGWSLEAAEVICANEELPSEDVLDLLHQLVSKSLVIAESTADHRLRYRMLETFRQFSHQKLQATGNVEQVERAHSAYFLSFARDGADGITRGDQLEWLERLQTEDDNFRAVLIRGLSLGGDSLTIALELASSLSWFWYLNSQWREAYDWLSSLLASSPGMRCARLGVIGPGSFFAWALGNKQNAATMLAGGIRLSNELQCDARTLGCALWHLSIVLTWAGDNDQAMNSFERAATVCGAAGLHW